MLLVCCDFLICVFLNFVHEFLFFLIGDDITWLKVTGFTADATGYSLLGKNAKNRIWAFYLVAHIESLECLVFFVNVGTNF